MNMDTAANSRKPKQSSVLLVVLGLVMVLFIGILIFVYVVSKRANPVLLDETGKPLNSQPAPNHPQASQSRR